MIDRPIQSLLGACLLAGCVSVPAPTYPIEYPKLVDGQPMIANEHGAAFTTSDCDAFDLNTERQARCEQVLGTKVDSRSWWTVDYGGRTLTNAEFGFMSPDYEEARDKYEAARSRCARGRVPKIAAYGFLIAAGGAWFLGERAGLDDTGRYIAVGGALGAAALMYGVGHLLAGGSCADADVNASTLDDIRRQHESGDNEISDSSPDELVKRFNAKHAPNAEPPTADTPSLEDGASE